MGRDVGNKCSDPGGQEYGFEHLMRTQVVAGDDILRCRGSLNKLFKLLLCLPSPTSATPRSAFYI